MAIVIVTSVTTPSQDAALVPIDLSADPSHFRRENPELAVSLH